jgi:D-glycero-alpha-D-manno-heptose-7-phosphate kinase
MRDLLSRGGDLDRFGCLLDQAWKSKKRLETSITNGCVDAIYDRGLKAGALGGKLLGAGSGGFVLFYCPPERQNALREELADFTAVPFAMEPEGSKIVYLGGER